MIFPPTFVMTINKKDSLPEESAGMMTIVIQRPYSRLEKELRNAFKGDDDVKVILDRRSGERRKRKKEVETDRRMADRRRPKEELVEVAIST
ncbi:MAG: hypothetical protein GTO16_12340 [Candidatus Aminicenantes bacterium]|nr:hypothetical protein [Candidatus Aminicenantes bacterium]